MGGVIEPEVLLYIWDDLAFGGEFGKSGQNIISRALFMVHQSEMERNYSGLLGGFSGFVIITMVASIVRREADLVA